MRPIDSVTVGVWTRDAGPEFESWLAALATQELDLPWELCVIAAGAPSTSVERLRRAVDGFAVSVSISTLHAEEFDEGEVRNWLALRGRGELLVHVTAGCAPASPSWLGELVAAFADPAVGAVLSERSGTPGERRLGAGDGELEGAVCAAALRRELWERHPFPRGSWGADLVVARALRAAGFEVLLRGDPTPPGGGEAQQVAPAPRQATAPTRLLDGGPLHVLYVVHGFPPETWAGTEIYTLELAREMQRLGHEVTIVARSDPEQGAGKDAAAQAGPDAPPDYSLRTDEFEGLRVLRMTRRSRVESIRETFDDPRAVVAFREVLLRARPDVVHFQHLIHNSAALVELAASFGLPTIVHCHDYWAICPRVQLIQPSGERCETNRGAGCYLCVHERAVSQIGRLESLESCAPQRIESLAAESSEPSTARGQRWAGLGELLERRDFVRDAYAAADLRVSPSRFLRQKLVDAGGFDPDTLLFSDNGIRTEHVHALAKVPAPSGRIRFGFVGSLVWYKGCEVLVEALNRLAGQPVQLDFHGDFRPDEEPFHARLAELATAGNVAFRGRFANARLSEVYAEIDVLVVPSLWFENSPITIHEAFLARTPVVASDIGGMAEYVRDGVDGLHFRVGDARDLARVLERFVREPDLLARLQGDWIPIKDIAENACENEFRYRQLASIVRPWRPLLFYEHESTHTVLRDGPVEEQGSDFLLVRPGGAVEYDLELAGGGRREVHIRLATLAGESDLRIGGRASIDGRSIGRFGPFRSSGADETHSAVLTVDLASPRTLRLTPEGRGAHLRILGVEVWEAASRSGPVGGWRRAVARAGGFLKSLAARTDE